MVRFTVPGVAEPQGSKTAMLMGKWITVSGVRALMNPRAIIVEGRDVKRKDGTRSDGRARHRQYRTAVQMAALHVYDRLGYKLDGPLSVEVTFYIPRPASTPVTQLYPATKPDLDKLARSVFDGCRPLIAEDSRIVRMFCEKLFTATSPRTLVAIETLPRTVRDLVAIPLFAPQ